MSNTTPTVTDPDRMEEHLRIKMWDDPMMDQLCMSVSIRRRSQVGGREVWVPSGVENGRLVFQRRETDDFVRVEPLLRFNRETSGEQLQMLADTLWELGFRPRGAKGSAGQLEACQAHINDLREITMRLLPKDPRCLSTP